MITRTPEEILAEIASCNQLTDFAGARRGDLIEFLPFDKAKEFLREGVTEEEWNDVQKPATMEAIKAAVEDYMPFAWDKANNMRGLSAARSIDHMTAYVFMTADEEFMKKFAETEYEHYGKEKLIVVCEYFGLDYKQWDDGVRTNG